VLPLLESFIYTPCMDDILPFQNDAWWVVTSFNDRIIKWWIGSYDDWIMFFFTQTQFVSHCFFLLVLHFILLNLWLMCLVFK
jgi:hypothetical protein